MDCVSAITQPQLLTVWDSHNCWLCDWPCECNHTATILRECIYSSNTLQCTWIPQNRVSCDIFYGTNTRVLKSDTLQNKLEFHRNSSSFYNLLPFSLHFPTWPWQKKEKKEKPKATIVDCVRQPTVWLTVWVQSRVKSHSHNYWLCETATIVDCVIDRVSAIRQPQYCVNAYTRVTRCNALEYHKIEFHVTFFMVLTLEF